MGNKIIQNVIDILRGKKKFSVIINSYSYRHKNNIEVSNEAKKHIMFDINGENNSILIDSSVKLSRNSKITIQIYGNNNKIIIGKNVKIEKLDIVIGQNHPDYDKVHDSKFIVGENTSIDGVQYNTYNSNTFCNIGKDCMFASFITIFNTDAHPIFSYNPVGGGGGKSIINKIKGITIGDHVWVGHKATILKNSFVPDNSIIGWGSVYSIKNITKNYCAYAGNPARLIKENVDWASDAKNTGYVENKQD